MYKLQQMCEYGFIDFNGNKWCDAWVDTYNNYSRHFNDCQGIGELSDLERETILDNRHKFFIWVLNFCKNERNQNV